MRELQVPKVAVELDCVGAVSKLTKEDKDRSIHGPLIEEIKSILSSFKDFSVKAIRRTANEVAHVLAKDSCVNKVCKVWRLVPPMIAVNRLNLDLSMI